MLVTLDSIITEVNPDLLNIVGPITVSPGVKVTWERETHSLNAESPVESK